MPCKFGGGGGCDGDDIENVVLGNLRWRCGGGVV